MARLALPPEGAVEQSGAAEEAGEELGNDLAKRVTLGGMCQGGIYNHVQRNGWAVTEGYAVRAPAARCSG